MDLRLQIAVLRARWLPVVAAILLAGVAAAGVSLVGPKVYESKATLIVGQSLSTANPDIGQIETSQRLGETYAQVAMTRPVLNAVIKTLGLSTTSDELRKHVAVAAARDSTLIAITVDQPDPRVAAAVANEIGARLIASAAAVQGEQSDIQNFIVDDLRALQGQIESAKAEADRLAALEARTPAEDRQLNALDGRLLSLRSTYSSLLAQSRGSVANRLSVVEPAVAATTPTSPKLLLNILLALLVGGLIGVAAAFLIEYVDDSVKTSEDAERWTGLPVLGSVPRMRDLPRGDPIYALATLVYPRSRAAESFRVLRTNLAFTGIDAPIKTIVVTSPLPLEGKTTVASNLAVAFAQAGRRTLLIDADLRRPGVHELFGIPLGLGLTDLLLSDFTDDEAIMHHTQEPNLRVIASGAIPPNPAELLGSARMKAVLERLSQHMDAVILDSPPVNVVTDGVVLAGLADGTILVVDSGRTRRDAALAARGALGRVGARILGLALNRSRQAADPEYGYYEDDVATSVPEAALDSRLSGRPTRAGGSGR